MVWCHLLLSSTCCLVVPVSEAFLTWCVKLAHCCTRFHLGFEICAIGVFSQNFLYDIKFHFTEPFNLAATGLNCCFAQDNHSVVLKQLEFCGM